MDTHQPPLSPSPSALDPAAHVAAIKQAIKNDPVLKELVRELFAEKMLTGLRDVKIIPRNIDTQK